jgi:hypothetical protein
MPLLNRRKTIECRDAEAKHLLLSTASTSLSKMPPLSLCAGLSGVNVESLQVFLNHATKNSTEDMHVVCQKTPLSLHLTAHWVWFALQRVHSFLHATAIEKGASDAIVDLAMDTIISLSLARGSLSANLSLATLLLQRPELLHTQHLEKLTRCSGVFDTYTLLCVCT